MLVKLRASKPARVCPQETAEGGDGVASTEPSRRKGTWTLEGDDGDDEEDPGGGIGGGPAAAGSDAAAAGGEVAEAVGGAAVAMEDDEEDPLDLFMARQVLPEVVRLTAEDAAAYAVEAATYQQASAAEAGAAAVGDVASSAVAAGAAAPNGLAVAAADDDEDPLDAFMAQNDAVKAEPPPAPAAPAAVAAAGAAPAVKGLVLKRAGNSMTSLRGIVVRPIGTGAKPGAGAAAKRSGVAAAAQPRGALRRAFAGSGSDSESSDDEGGGSSSDDDEAWAKKAMTGKLSKADKLGLVDHTQAMPLRFSAPVAAPAPHFRFSVPSRCIRAPKP